MWKRKDFPPITPKITAQECCQTGSRGVQEPVPYCSPGMWDLLEGLAVLPLQAAFPSALLTAPPSSFPPSSCPSPPFPRSLPDAIPQLSPYPPKSNQIHNLIRQKNEENVRLPASPVTGCRPAANLEIGKCYSGATTDWWGGGGVGSRFQELPIVGSRRNPSGGPPSLLSKSGS